MAAEIDRRVEVLEIGAEVQIGREGARQLEALQVRHQLHRQRLQRHLAGQRIDLQRRGEARPLAQVRHVGGDDRVQVAEVDRQLRQLERALLGVDHALDARVEAEPRHRHRRQHRVRDGQPGQVRAADERQPIVAKPEIEVRVHLALGRVEDLGRAVLVAQDRVELRQLEAIAAQGQLALARVGADVAGGVPQLLGRAAVAAVHVDVLALRRRRRAAATRGCR